MPYDRAVRTWIAFAVSLAFLSGCGGSGSGPADVSLPQDRLELPQYDLASYRELIETLRGTPVVVNFWGSWCPPCEDEAPHLADVSNEYQGDVQFLGVNMADAREPAREFIERFNLPYPSIFDPRDTIRSGLGYLGQPITLIYDRAGSIAWDVIGTTSAEELRKQIENVL